MFTSVWKDIHNGKLFPVYLLSGTEHYYFDETISRIKQALSKEEETEFITFDLDETPVELVLEEADTVPFFSTRKFIVAKNASFLKATDKSKEKIVHNIKVLENWLANPSPTAITIFIAPYEKLDERKKITKLMKEKSVYLEGKSLQQNDLKTWILSEVHMNNKSISNDAVAKLIDIVGTDLIHLRSEIEKMSLYLGDEKEITEQLIEGMVAKTLDQDAFKMLNSYLKGDISVALSVYHDLIRQKEEPIMLTALLSSQIRLMHHVYYLKKKGYHQQQIAKQLKVNPYRVKIIMESGQQISEQKLLQVLHELAEVDLKLKSTSGNRERILELLLMRRLS